MMKRCDKKLEDFEKKLKLVEKFENAREKVATIQTEIQALRNAENRRWTERLRILTRI